MVGIARAECPEHGPTLTAARRWAPKRWCNTCSELVDPVVVEYVRADVHPGAVATIGALRHALAKAAIQLGDAGHPDAAEDARAALAANGGQCAASPASPSSQLSSEEDR